MRIRGLLRRLLLLPTHAATMLAATALLGAVVLGAPATAQPFVKFTLDGRIDSNAAPFLLALDQGWLKAEGLDVSIDPATSPQEALTRVAAGTYDFGLVDINALVRWRDQNPTATLRAVFMVENRPPFAVLARRSRGIVGPKDLEGKRVGASTADDSLLHLQVLARVNGIDPARIRLETVAVQVREPMLASGQVDAISATTLTGVDLEARGVPAEDIVVLPMAEFGVSLYGQAIVVSPRMLAERGSAVRAFLRVVVRALNATVADPDRAIDAVTKRIDPQGRSHELRRLGIAVRSSLLTPEVRQIGYGAVEPGRFARSIDQLALAVEFRIKPKPSDVFDPAWLPPLEERLPQAGGPVNPGGAVNQ